MPKLRNGHAPGHVREAAAMRFASTETFVFPTGHTRIRLHSLEVIFCGGKAFSSNLYRFCRGACRIGNSYKLAGSPPKSPSQRNYCARIDVATRTRRGHGV